MIAESLMGTQRPPKVTGDVDIARFLSATGPEERWRVSIGGDTHFLADAATAHRIYALAIAPAGADTYDQAYARYRAQRGNDAEPMADFVAWCERHCASLQQLATQPDGHALRLRRKLVSRELCGRIAGMLAWLFAGRFMVPLWLLSVLAAGSFLVHGTPATPHSFWGALILALVGVFVHEIGHITACVRHGGRQGGIGVGLYWIWPAFFADVRGSWSLQPGQRLQVSLGGLYFQSVYAAVLAAIGFATASGTIAAALHVTLLLMASTINPVLKFDGYWILSDLFNVTNLHTRVAEHLRSLVAGPPAERHRLLRTRWTAVSLIFGTCAVTYMAYVTVALGRASVLVLAQTPAAWRSLAEAYRAAAMPDLTLAAGHCASVALQLLLIGAAFVILGMRSLRATLGLVAAPRTTG